MKINFRVEKELSTPLRIWLNKLETTKEITNKVKERIFKDAVREYTLSTLKPEILKRDNYKCVVCGSEEKLEIHHKEYVFSDNLDYCITLCQKCHNKLRNKK